MTQGKDYKCKLEWKGTANFTSGRKGRMPIAIVNHITAGLMPGPLAWLQNPAAKVSAHYLITRSGIIYQLVKNEDTAWANGIVNKPNWSLYDGTNPNFYTLSIEHEGLAGDALTEKQYEATRCLHLHLIKLYGIPVDEEHIIGHYRIDSIHRSNCPGPNFPWQRLLADLKGSNNPVCEQWKLDLIKEAKKAGLISSDHDPDEPASKWFVLAVALNLINKKRG